MGVCNVCERSIASILNLIRHRMPHVVASVLTCLRVCILHWRKGRDHSRHLSSDWRGATSVVVVFRCLSLRVSAAPRHAQSRQPAVRRGRPRDRGPRPRAVCSAEQFGACARAMSQWRLIRLKETITNVYTLSAYVNYWLSKFH